MAKPRLLAMDSWAQTLSFSEPNPESGSYTGLVFSPLLLTHQALWPQPCKASSLTSILFHVVPLCSLRREATWLFPKCVTTWGISRDYHRVSLSWALPNSILLGKVPLRSLYYRGICLSLALKFSLLKQSDSIRKAPACPTANSGSILGTIYDSWSMARCDSWAQS